jgi:hypothetical protein
MGERKAAAPILAALLILAVPLGAYVGGYFWLGDKRECRAPPWIGRTYPQPWQVPLFKPAGAVEGWLRGENTIVEIKCQADLQKP